RWRYHGENYAGEDRLAGQNPPKAGITYFLAKKPKQELLMEIVDEKGTLIQKYTSKKVEPDYEEDNPDPPWVIFKPTILETKPGLHRVDWDLTHHGPKIIPGAKNDAGIPYRGPLVLPGKYAIKLTIDGETLTSSIEVKMDPRVKSSAAELAASHKLALEIRAD